MNDNERAEAEKEVRVTLKIAGYGYPEFYDEMVDRELFVDLHTDQATYTVEVTAGDGVLARARMGRYSQRALDRAARQVRAQLQVEGVLEPWDRAR